MARRAALVISTILAALGMGAAMAWACTAAATLVTESPAAPVTPGADTGTWVKTGSALPGATVRLRGEWYFQGPVEIRWNDLAGPELAVANGPDFATEVKLPDANPGVYSVVALQREPDTGEIRSKKTAAIEILAPAGAAASAQAPGTASSGGDAPWSARSTSRPLANSAARGSRSHGLQLSAGIALLGLGAVGLVGGSLFAVTARRRRKA